MCIYVCMWVCVCVWVQGTLSIVSHTEHKYEIPHCCSMWLSSSSSDASVSKFSVVFTVQYICQVFDTILKEVWYQPDTSLFAKIIDCLGKSREPQQAQSLFDRMVNEGLEPVQSNYTALIGAHCMVGNYAKGIELLRHMQLRGISPTRYTYERIMQGCKEKGAIELKEEMRSEMEIVFEGFERKPIITRKKWQRYYLVALRGFITLEIYLFCHVYVLKEQSVMWIANEDLYVWYQNMSL